MDSYNWRAYFHAYGVKETKGCCYVTKHKVTEGDRRKKKTEDGESAGMHICDNRTRSRIPRTVAVGLLTVSLCGAVDVEPW